MCCAGKSEHNVCRYIASVVIDGISLNLCSMYYCHTHSSEIEPEAMCKIVQLCQLGKLTLFNL
jgi:hypothetical protein